MRIPVISWFSDTSWSKWLYCTKISIPFWYVKNAVCADWSQEEKGQNEEVNFISPKTFTTIDLTVTSSSDPISVDNTDDELVLKIASI